ncbi:hypothetical protein [Nocardia huaxiensis]|uniref:Uncharacterized protein n=1 Tax=Nocardia huaxiensis TaxID=2755382 RepID=A0A7D6VDJ8_9NOCA|nr:hypothetical protein [Nocardia huaxiensis]QLY29895.1 hypothetical protein H0264_32560 [Nocardia huaxiensis]UFS96516.1 hypothetical protein LPY97_00810 [Nocardia huaxiensis]
MGTVVLMSLGVLFFITGPALALVIVLGVRKSARDTGNARQRAHEDAGRIPAGRISAAQAQIPELAGGRHRRY